MCGIVGYVGARPCRDLLVAGLEKLEYRGYDSAGISLLHDGQIDSVRAVGNLEHLRAAVAADPGGEGAVAVAAPPATIGLAHTRWATHGRVSEQNAHPHGDCSDRIHIVLNGIVENHAELRRELTDNGHFFSSETDAEIVAHLIERHYEGDLTAAVDAAFEALRGHYAFVAMHADHPRTLVAARQECPLVIGLREDEAFVASAIPAFLAETRTVQYVANGELITIEPGSARFTDRSGSPVDRAPEVVDWDEDVAEKGGFETFMLKEIHEQADAVAETITDRLPGTDRVDLAEIHLPADLPATVRRIVIVACGTSYHAGLVGRYAIERWARVPVEMDIASEYRYRQPVVGPDDLVIGITQSGETADTLAAMRLARDGGAKVLALTNVMGSQATRDADAVLYTRAGLEMGVAATKTFVSQVACMYLLGLWLAQDRGGLAPDRIRELISELKSLPARLQETIPAVDRQVGDRRERPRRPLLPLPGSQHRPPGLSRGGAEDEGDHLHPLRRLCRRRDEARPDRPARHLDARDLRGHREPDPRQDALQHRGGQGKGRGRDRGRHRRLRGGGRGRRRDDLRPPNGLGPAADRGDRPAPAARLPGRPRARTERRPAAQPGEDGDRRVRRLRRALAAAAAATALAAAAAGCGSAFAQIGP
jgi:glutamine---fructose-6-phosphate transaminase (isomerizing)